MRDPTCVYYEHLPCERMKECTVHGPLLRRPFKKRHYLRRALARETWWPDAREPVPQTFCGAMLHPRQILDEEVGKILANPEFEKDTPESLRWLRAYSEFRLYNPTWLHLPIRLVGQDPDIQVYYELGSSRREILVVEKDASCGQCLKSARSGRYGLPAMLDRREDPKRKPYRAANGRGEGSEQEPERRADQSDQGIPHP